MTQLTLPISLDGREVSKFKIILTYIKEDGTNIDNWTFEDLTQCVKDYYLYCENQQYQQYSQPAESTSYNYQASDDFDNRTKNIIGMNQAMDQSEFKN